MRITLAVVLTAYAGSDSISFDDGDFSNDRNGKSDDDAFNSSGNKRACSRALRVRRGTGEALLNPCDGRVLR